MNRAVTYASRPSALPVSAGRETGGWFGRAQELLIRASDTVLAWEDRSRERHRLATLDERLLQDIGVDLASADTEARKPFWRS